MTSRLHTLWPWRRSWLSGGQRSAQTTPAWLGLPPQSQPNAAADHFDLPSTSLLLTYGSPAHLAKGSETAIHICDLLAMCQLMKAVIRQAKTKDQNKQGIGSGGQRCKPLLAFCRVICSQMALKLQTKARKNGNETHLKHLGFRISKWVVASRTCQLFHHADLLLHLQGSLGIVLSLCSLTSGRSRY